MNSRELKELIQKELDGEATPAERDQLRGILDTSREARAEYLAMEEMVRRIDQLVDGVEPPSQFKERVISSLREEGADPQHWRPPTIAPRSLPFYYAWAGMLFVVLGIAGYQFLRGSSMSLNPSDMAGAIGTVNSWSVISTQRWSAANGSIDTVVRRHHDAIVVEATIVARPGQSIEARWNPALLELESFDSDTARDHALVRPDRLVAVVQGEEQWKLHFSLTKNQGEERPAVTFSVAGPPILTVPLTGEAKAAP
jgi:hypothetical protein